MSGIKILERKSYFGVTKSHLFSFYKENGRLRPYGIYLHCCKGTRDFHFPTLKDATNYIENCIEPGPISEIDCNRCCGVIFRLKQDGKIN